LGINEEHPIVTTGALWLVILCGEGWRRGSSQITLGFLVKLVVRCRAVDEAGYSNQLLIACSAFLIALHCNASSDRSRQKAFLDRLQYF